jgi:gamma-glutamyltranspeptidase/glutathione hydrolase
MQGAVAAGHPLTVEAGARALAEGGNAVDACIAAGLVSWVAESPLTGPGGGGFMLVHRARDRTDRTLDFFVAVPGRGVPAGFAPAPMPVVDIPFDSENLIPYWIGPPTVAVPGAIAGLAEAHRLYGRLPWPELVAPAREHARDGVAVSREQASLHALLDPILRSTGDSRAVFGAGGPLAEGDRIRMPELADTLARLAAEGAEPFYRGDLARATSRAVLEGGGSLTEDDLATYRVVRRTPVRASFRGFEFVSNPPPSSGGILIAFALGVLDRLGPPDPPGGPAQIARLAEVMREATRARGGSFAADLHRGGLAGRLLDGRRLAEAADHIRAGARDTASERVGLPSTTHVSAVDADGNAASFSASTGAGSGFFVPGTGIHLNNMLGESDLAAPGAQLVPGRRLTSMMAPSVVLEGSRPRLVLGSAGSMRLRAAITQTAVNALDHDLPLEEAISAPRVHLHEGRLHLEGGIPDAVADDLTALGYDVVRWDGHNIFFGGVSAVSVGPRGVEAAGDPRRGGRGTVLG